MRPGETVKDYSENTQLAREDAPLLGVCLVAVRKNLGTGSNLKTVAGPLAAARFTPGASTAAIVTSESWGIQSITRDSAGVYTLKVQGKVKGMCAVAVGQENDTTNYHWVRVESQSDTAGTVTISHKTQAFASVASAPTASDTIDSIVVYIYGRSD